MAKGKSNKVVFKPYIQNQPELIPPSASELIPENHLVRIVDDAINKMELSPILEQYSVGGGASRYHPLMLLKVLVYACICGIYSSRKIVNALRENIFFMWLSGRQHSDFRTINEFRSSRLKPVIDQVFISSVKLLAHEGYVSLHRFFLDGTKIEANANRYTFVWKKAIESFDKKIDEKLREFIQEVDNIAEEENIKYGKDDLEEMGKGPISSELVEKLADELSKAVKQLENPDDQKPSEKVKKKLKKMAKQVKENYLPRKNRYESIKKKFKGLNSYSKTDEDSTFMRMKDDHMRNGQLKPGYNIQIGTENNFVLTYGLYPNPTDTRPLKKQVQQFKTDYDQYPTQLIADAGYGSEENYAYLEENDIEALVKYSMYHNFKKKRSKKFKYSAFRWKYDETKDVLVCPKEQTLEYAYTKEYTSEAGYKTDRRIYKCSSCNKCQDREKCTKSEFRCTAFSPKLWKYHQNVIRLLESGQGQQIYKRRGHEVETVFGQIKSNMQFKKFLLRGKEKVNVEWGLLMLGYNIKTKFRKMFKSLFFIFNMKRLSWINFQASPFFLQ